MLAKFIASITLLVSSVVVSILVLINGYGLTIESWGWVIGGAFLQMFILMLNLILAKEG